VLRGGSWNNNENNTRAGNRNNNEPQNRNNNNGFRPARSSHRESAFLREREEKNMGPFSLISCSPASADLSAVAEPRASRGVAQAEANRKKRPPGW